MSILSANEERFWGKTDSETLQNLIDFAAANGENAVTIPHRNARTGGDVYVIDRCVYIPDDMTVILDGCHLRLADGVRENIFRNSALRDGAPLTLANEQRGIHLIGQCGAVLDGGEPNSLCEQLRRDHPDKYPPMLVNLLVFFVNVRDFEVRGIRVKDSRWWAYCFVYCRWGTLSDLSFEMHGTLENQDGIDLRVGCEYITIENITGMTGDDTVALTALPMGYLETTYHVAGKKPHIHDITISNIISSSHGCSVLRFLCEDGAKEYNITVDGIKDTGLSLSGASILFGSGDTRFAKDHPHRIDEFENIVVRNVTTNAQRGISFAEPVRNLLVENVTTYGRNEIGIAFSDNFECENFILRNFTFGADPKEADCVFSVSAETLARMKDYRIEHVRAASAKYTFRRGRPVIADGVFSEPFAAEMTDEAPRLRSAYGRYFRCFYGKEI